MKRIISVLLVFTVLFASGAASLSAYGEDLPKESMEAEQSEKITASRFETILNNNYAFGEDFSSVSKIIDAATVSLLAHSENGVLKNSLIIDLVNNMYGIDALVLCDEGKEVLTADGVYEIIPRGFEKYSHTVTDIHRHADMTLTVYSDAVTLDENGEEVTYTAISRFAQNDNSPFGYILLSCEILTNEQTAEISAI